MKIDYTKGEEYNENVMNELEEMAAAYSKVTMKPNHALVKLFKYEGEMKTEGGIIVEDFDVIQTEGGQLKSRINTNPYQSRGVILNVSNGDPDNSFYDSIRVGTIVHLMGSNFSFFKLDKRKKGQDTNGIILINLHAVEAVEK